MRFLVISSLEQQPGAGQGLRKCRGRHGQESILESNIAASNSLRGEWTGGRISCPWVTWWHGLLANPDAPGMEVIRKQRLGLVALPVWR